VRYKLFGRTGLRVSEVCLGTMTFGEDWGWGASREESQKIFDAFVSAGGNFIDTANHYTNGKSEQLLGEFIRRNRDDYVISTKYTLTENPADPNAGGNQRKNLMRAVEGSLRRLGTDHLDVYWMHAWDFLTPVEEVVRGLDDLVRAGKVLYLGISDAPAWYVAEANTMAEVRGWSAFAGLQVQYSLIERTPERELLPYAMTRGMLVTAWSPLGGGMLTGKYGAGRRREAAAGSRHATGGLRDYFLTDRNFEIAGTVEEIANETGSSMADIALAWVRKRPGSLVPILGARTLNQLMDNLRSLDLELDDAQMERLNTASAIDLGFPLSFLSTVLTAIYGDTFEKIDVAARGY
jgi:aryl-alcohol dehydrogenase-like predicted oxidoreductase